MSAPNNPSALKLGVFGFGRITQKVYLPIFEELGISPTLIVDVDHTARKHAKRRFPHAVISDGTSNAELSSINTALIATPNTNHAHLIQALLKQGVRTLCEKPLATHAEPLRCIRDQDLESCLLHAAYPSTHRPDVCELFAPNTIDLIGEPHTIHLSWQRTNGVPSGWFREKEQAGGGALIDLGSHLMHAALSRLQLDQASVCDCSLVRDVNHDSQQYWDLGNARLKAPCTVETGASACIEFSGKKTVRLEVSWHAEVDHDTTEIVLLGDYGEARLRTLFGFNVSPHPPTLSISTHDGWSSCKTLDSGDPLNPHRKILRNFLSCTSVGSQTARNDLKAAIQSVGVIEKLYEIADYE